MFACFYLPFWYQVNSIDRSPDGTIIATGDDFRRVKIFKYPCPKEKSKYKEYKGHAEFVVNVKFSKCGKWLYSVGGLDKAVFQFEVKGGTGTGAGATAATSFSTGMSAMATTTSSSSSSSVSSKAATKPSKGRKSRTS